MPKTNAQQLSEDLDKDIKDAKAFVEDMTNKIMDTDLELAQSLNNNRKKILERAKKMIQNS